MSESQRLVDPSDTTADGDSDAETSSTHNSGLNQRRSHLPRGHCGQWRDCIAFWLLGLCNNYAYVVMLSAAHDLLSSHSKQPRSVDIALQTANGRDCNPTSTGAILLADIVPALLVKSVAPLVTLSTNARVTFVVIMSTLSFVLAASNSSTALVYVGVVLASLSSGLGEVTLLAHSAGYVSGVVSAWSSGTGFSGVLGSFSYAALTAAGVTPSAALLAMLVCPAVMTATYVCVLRRPAHQADSSVGSVSRDPVLVGDAPLSWRQKRRLLRYTPAYMLPLGGVYFFEYLINQGLLELVWFAHGTGLSHAEQYRWLQVSYQVGVFVSRSSASVVRVRRISVLAMLQAANACVFLLQAWLMWIPWFWAVVGLVLWEGLLGGAAYVNTFAAIHEHSSGREREFLLGTVSVADSAGIALAAVASLPLHDAFCKLPRPDVR